MGASEAGRSSQCDEATRSAKTDDPIRPRGLLWPTWAVPKPQMVCLQPPPVLAPAFRVVEHHVQTGNELVVEEGVIGDLVGGHIRITPWNEWLKKLPLDAGKAKAELGSKKGYHQAKKTGNERAWGSEVAHACKQ